MGVGCAVDEVRARIESGTIGHVGLPESLDYVAAGLGWIVGAGEERLEPVVATEGVSRGGEHVERGKVIGLDHSVRASDAEGRSIRLHLVMRLDADEPTDEIIVDGEPGLHLVFSGGVNGDIATVATVLNSARFAVEAPAGLIARIPVPRAEA